MCDLILATRSASEFYPWRGAKPETFSAIHHPPLAFFFPLQRGEAERRQTQVTNRRACARRALDGARTPVGVPPRLSPKGIIPSQRLSFRPGFQGRGLNGRYPPSPVPVQGCTSRPGHNVGGLIPKPPGSRLQIRPRAPPSLPWRGVPPRHVLHWGEDANVTVMGTNVKIRLVKSDERL